MRAEPQDSSHAAVATDIFVSANGLRFIYKFLKKKTARHSPLMYRAVTSTVERKLRFHCTNFRWYSAEEKYTRRDYMMKTKFKTCQQ